MGRDGREGIVNGPDLYAAAEYLREGCKHGASGESCPPTHPRGALVLCS